MGSENPSEELPYASEQIPLTSTAEGMAEVSEAAQERINSLKIWDEKLNQMDDPTKAKLIKSMDRHTLQDKVIDGYPNLAIDYQNLKAKALDILGEKGLELLGGKDIGEVVGKLFKDKIDLDNTGDLKMHERKNEILTTNLKAFIKICEEKMTEVLPAQMAKIDQPKKDAEELLRQLDKSLH
jgi:hypothetical protein